MDLPRDARDHRPNRPSLLLLQCIRQDRATSTPNGSGRRRRTVDYDAGDESSPSAFLQREPEPHRNRPLQTTKHAVPVRLEILITDWAVIVSHIPPVQLQYQSPIRNKPLVLGAAMRTSTTKETLIPAAAGFDIMHANQWLWAHGN